MSRVDEIHQKAIDAVRVAGELMGASSSYPVAKHFAARALVAEARAEKLEGLLNRLVAAADDSEMDFEDLGKFAWTHLAEARTLLADESKENEQ